ncbi:MAG: ShlB/FhaC/HecB family hemolysin secretion/activation protein [Gammaproteobacteria bacterium]|nr:ShlB/FhaC/HecB family hemolysin secretion/activation protein [Gammaproteobacteria bacterium]
MRVALMVGMLLGLSWLGESHAATDAVAPNRFDVLEYRVEGNTLLEVRQIERLVYEHLGPQRTIGDVEAARGALESAYRDAGYPTVSVVIPEQSTNSGVVQLQVVEQRVGRLRVTGATYNSGRRIRDAVPSLSPGSVLDANAVQRDLDALARRSRDVSYNPVIRSGQAVGEIDVDLVVKDRLPLHGRFELNNFASANTSELRAAASASYGNLFQRQHALSLSGQVSPEDTQEVRVLAASYIARPQANDHIYALTAVKSDSDVAAVGGTTVLGSGEFVFLHGYFPLRASPEFSDTFDVGIDYKRSDDVTEFATSEGGVDAVNVSTRRSTTSTFRLAMARATRGSVATTATSYPPMSAFADSPTRATSSRPSASKANRTTCISTSICYTAGPCRGTA